MTTTVHPNEDPMGVARTVLPHVPLHKPAPDGSLRVRIRPETVPKWLAIAKARRWTLAETADALADAYLLVAMPPVPYPTNGDGAGA